MTDAVISAPMALTQTRYGPLLFLGGDQYVGRSMELYGEFSELEASLFAQIVRAGDVVVEVGANIGAHTVHLAKMVGPQGRVYAFEPQRVIFQILCANVALNGLFNVYTQQAGVSNEAGQLQVPALNYGAVGNFGGLSLAQENAGIIGELVPMMTVDSLKLPAVKILKVDVEGMEYEALSGARATITEHRPFLYVENDRKDKSPALIALIEELGYTMYWHLPSLYNPDNFKANKDNVFPGIVSVNLLCVPKESGLKIEGFRQVTGPDDWWQMIQVPSIIPMA